MGKLFLSDSTDLYEMFAGTALTYTYKSGILTEGNYANLKTYKDFYIKYNGVITVKLYLMQSLTLCI